MPAFEAAVALGYRYLETDVHVTADGVLLAFHDDRLDRVTDGSGRIGDLPWRDVQQARVDGSQPIPLLEDLLGAWPDVLVNIDIKHDAAVEPLASTLRRLDALDRVCVGSFSGRRLRRARAVLGPGLCSSLGPLGTLRLRLRSYGLPLGRPTGDCAQLPVRRGPLPLVDERLVRTAHRLAMPVHVWTIDDPGEMERLLDLGVDGLMTDQPAVLKGVLSRRGQWSEG